MPNIAREVGLRDFGRLLREAIQPRVAQEPVPEALEARGAPQSAPRNMDEAAVPHVSRRVRRPSPRTVEKQVGRPITSVTHHRDGSRTDGFGQPVAANEAAPAEEPPRTSLFKARTTPKMKVVL